ncbi:hypothetical protein [Spirosoma arboris]|nr:hypothetical protein [Spirosoma arboris]
MVRFFLQIAGFGLLYTLILVATFPFLIYWGPAKPWQKFVQFLMEFPVDNEKIGVFSLPGMVAVMFLNGLLWGLMVVSLFKAVILLRNLAY